MSKKCIKNPYSIACLLICFLAQDMAWGASELFKAPSRVVATTVNQILANPTNIQVPYEHATLKEIHQSTSKLNQKLIILIEDAHSNYSGQMSLAGSLDEMMRTYGLSLILAEGSSKDVTLDEVKDLADAKTWQIAAKRFLMEGVISGEEYLNLTSDLPMSIRGMEYQDLYEKNLKTYSNLVKRRRDILLYLHKINISISKVKTKLYPKILLDYELAKAKSDSEGGGFTPYLDDFFALQEEAQIKLIQDYPEVSQLKQLRLKEKAIDFELANREQGALYRSISQKGAKDEINHIIEASKRSKNLQISQYSLLTRVFTLAKEYGMDSTNHKELNKYYDYLKAFTDLKLNPLLEQIERLEDEFYKVLLTEEDTRRVRIIDRYVGLLDKAYRIQMSSTDFQTFIANRPDFNTQSWEAFLNLKLEELDYLEDLIPYLSSIDDAESDLRDFYETVNDRDEAFVENTERIMQEEGQQAAFMIAGGYHTHNLTRLLREKDYSYVVLTPVVTFETDHNKYEQLLLMPLEGNDISPAAQTNPITDLNLEQPTTLRANSILTFSLRLAKYGKRVHSLSVPRLAKRLEMLAAARMSNQRPRMGDMKSQFIQTLSESVAELRASSDSYLDYYLNKMFRDLDDTFRLWASEDGNGLSIRDKVINAEYVNGSPVGHYGILGYAINKSGINTEQFDNVDFRTAIISGLVEEINLEIIFEEQYELKQNAENKANAIELHIGLAKTEIGIAKKEFDLDSKLNSIKSASVSGILLASKRLLISKKPLTQKAAEAKIKQIKDIINGLGNASQYKELKSELKIIRAWYTNAQFPDRFSTDEIKALTNLEAADERDVASLNRYSSNPNDDIHALAQLTLGVNKEVFRGPRLQYLITRAEAGQNEILRNAQILGEEAEDVLGRLEKVGVLGSGLERENFIKQRRAELKYLKDTVTGETQIDFNPRRGLRNSTDLTDSLSLRELSVEQIQERMLLKTADYRSKPKENVTAIGAWNLLLFGKKGQTDHVSGYQLISKQIRSQYLIPGSVLQFESGEYRRIVLVEAMTYEYQKIDSQGNTLDEIRVDNEDDAIKLTDRIMDGRVKNISGEVTSLVKLLRNNMNQLGKLDYYRVHPLKNNAYASIQLNSMGGDNATAKYTYIARDPQTGELSLETEIPERITLDDSVADDEYIVLQLAIDQLNIEEAARMSGVVRGGLELQKGNFGSDLELRVNGKAATLKWSEDGNSIILNSDSQPEVKIKLNEKDPTPIMWEGAEIHVQPNDDGVSVQIINKSPSGTYIASIDRSEGVGLTIKKPDSIVFKFKRVNTVDFNEQAGEYRIPSESEPETIYLSQGRAILDIFIVDNQMNQPRSVEIVNKINPNESVIVSLADLARGVSIGRGEKDDLYLSDGRISRTHLILSIDRFGNVNAKHLSETNISKHRQEELGRGSEFQIFTLDLSEAEQDLINEALGINPYAQAQYLPEAPVVLRSSSDSVDVNVSHANEFVKQLKEIRDSLGEGTNEQKKVRQTFFSEIDIALSGWTHSGVDAPIGELINNMHLELEGEALDRLNETNVFLTYYFIIKSYRAVLASMGLSEAEDKKALFPIEVVKAIQTGITDELAEERDIQLKSWLAQGEHIVQKAFNVEVNRIAATPISNTDYGELTPAQDIATLQDIIRDIGLRLQNEDAARKKTGRSNLYIKADQFKLVKLALSQYRLAISALNTLVSPEQLTTREKALLKRRFLELIDSNDPEKTKVYLGNNPSIGIQAFVYLGTVNLESVRQYFANQRIDLISQLAKQGERESRPYLEYRKSKANRALSRWQMRMDKVEVGESEQSDYEKQRGVYDAEMGKDLKNLSYGESLLTHQLYREIYDAADQVDKPGDIFWSGYMGLVYELDNELVLLNKLDQPINEAIELLAEKIKRQILEQSFAESTSEYFTVIFPTDHHKFDQVEQDYLDTRFISEAARDGSGRFVVSLYLLSESDTPDGKKGDIGFSSEKNDQVINSDNVDEQNLRPQERLQYELIKRVVELVNAGNKETTNPQSLQNQLVQIRSNARMGQRNVVVGDIRPKMVSIGGKEIEISLSADKQFIKFGFQDKAYAKYNSRWSINEPFSPITIGRDGGRDSGGGRINDWVFNDLETASVSRQHVTISIEPEGLMLTNHSQNGTLVDGDYLGGDKEDGSSFEDKTIIIEFRQVSEDNDVVVDAYVTSLLDLIRIAGGVYRRAEKSNERRKDKPSHASVETARDEYGIVRDEYGPNKTLAKDLFLIQRLKKGLDNALGSQLEQIKRLPAGSRSEFKQLITDAKTAQRKLFRSQAYLNRITTEKEFTSDEGLIIDALYAEIKLKSDISVFRQRDLSDVKLTQALKAFAIVGSLESIENEFPGQRADLIRQYAKQGQRHALAHLKQSRSKTELALERWSTRLDEMENQDTFLERPLYESRKRDFDNSESSYDEYFSIKRNGKAVRELTYNDAIRANEFYRNVSNEADNRIRSGDIISAEDDPNESSDQWSNAKRRPTAPRMAGLDAVKSFEALSDLLGKLRGRIAGLTEADIMTEAGRLGPIDGELKVSFAKLHKLNFVSELDDSARNLEERQKSLSDTTPFESRAIVRQSSPLNGLYRGIEDLIVSATEAEEMRDLIIIRDRAINQSVGSQGEDSQVTALMRLAAERVVLFWRKGEGDLSLEDTFREYSQILDLERRTGLMLIDSNSLTVPNTEDLGALNTRFQKLANEHQLRLLNHLKAYAENEQLEGELKDYFNARGLYQEAISAITTFVRNSFDLRSTININSRDQALELLNEFDAELKTFESFDGEQIIEYEGKDETPDLFDVMRQVLIAAVRNIDERLSNAEQIDEGSTDYASVYGSLPRFSARMTPIFNASTEEGMDELLRFVSIYGVDGFDPEATNVTPEDIERMQMKEAVLIDGPKGKAINIILEGEVFTLELNNHSATLGSTTNAVTFNISRSELIRQKSLSDADIKTSGQSIILPSSASVLDTIQSVDAVRDRVQIFNQFVRRLRRKTAQMDQKIHFHLHLDEGIGDTEAYQSVLSKLTFNDPNLEVTLSSFTGAPVSIGDEAIGDEVIIKEIVFTGPKGLVNIPGKKFTVLNVGASGDGLANIGDVALRGFQLSAIKLSDGDTLSAGDTQRALENLARGQASFENKPTMQAVQYMYKFPGTDKAVEVLIQFPAKRNLTIEDLLRIGTMMEKSVNWAA